MKRIIHIVEKEEALNWHEANQSYLTAEVSSIRRLLERYVADSKASPPKKNRKSGERSSLRGAEEPLSPPASLDTLCDILRLSAFERGILLMCAGMELDFSFANLCAAAQGDSTRAQPTFGLALAALPGSHWSALGPEAPLRRWRLVELGAGDTLTQSPLRIDERILHFLTGVPAMDGRLHGVGEPLPLQGEPPPSQQPLAERISGLWNSEKGNPPAVNLCGPDRSGMLAAVAAASAALGLKAHPLNAADIPTATVERETLALLWERESLLGRRVLYLDCHDRRGPESVENGSALQLFMDGLRARLIVGSREPVHPTSRAMVRLDVGKPTTEEQLRLWRDLLGPNHSRLDGHLERLVEQFDLGFPAIRMVAAEVGRQPPHSLVTDETDEAGSRLWEACLSQSRPSLDSLAVRIDPAADWDDLVLPEQQRRTLGEIVSHVRHRALVYRRWGFASKGSRGLGITALFAGLSGTGKTMAAEVLAEALRLDLYRIDLSSVVSKYIGETEKNLRSVFDAAEKGGAILLFDEADALFGKRSEVKDSHDRHANIEVSYLLQRMETYRGLAILTTNMKSALDNAFLRRIRFVVQFPFPDPAQRAEIWRRIFPSKTPTEGLDPTKLARLNVAGGNIRNIALNAAFLAAEAGEAVGMAHLLSAARDEYAKLERPMTDAETGRWT